MQHSIASEYNIVEQEIILCLRQLVNDPDQRIWLIDRLEKLRAKRECLEALSRPHDEVVALSKKGMLSMTEEQQLQSTNRELRFNTSELVKAQVLLGNMERELLRLHKQDIRRQRTLREQIRLAFSTGPARWILYVSLFAFSGILYVNRDMIVPTLGRLAACLFGLGSV